MIKISHIGLDKPMEVFEKINYLIEEKNISKRKFVNDLLALEPKLKATGEIPSEQTIYRYLNAQRELKIELIPYIAEVLEVDEQELFRFDIEYATEYNLRYSKDAREILDLLQYAPCTKQASIYEILIPHLTPLAKNLAKKKAKT